MRANKESYCVMTYPLKSNFFQSSKSVFWNSIALKCQ
uniref:Uncharacterized protein n=1 Tax=Anguilla anguilla TaxID=7936 RepID=A0A0E9Q2C4_ANGAN